MIDSKVISNANNKQKILFSKDTISLAEIFNNAMLKLIFKIALLKTASLKIKLGECIEQMFKYVNISRILNSKLKKLKFT